MSLPIRKRIFARLFALVSLLLATLAAAAGMVDLLHQERKATRIYAAHARLAAVQAVDMVLWDDRVALRDLLFRLVSGDPARGYAFVERGGDPYVWTFVRGVPRGLLLGRMPAGRVSLVRRFEDEQGRGWYDVAATADGGAMVLHLGVSRRELWRRGTRDLAAVAGFTLMALGAGALLAWGIAGSATRELEQATAVLEGRQARWRSLTMATPDAIVTAGPDGRINGFNRAAEELFGRRADEVMGRGLEILVPERMRAAHRESFSRAARTGDLRLAGQAVEISALAADGREVPVELSLGMWGEAGDRGFVAVIRDVRERRAAEARQRRLEEELYHVRKNSSLKVMAGAVAHSFNNILTAVIGNLELAGRQCGPGSDLAELVANSRRAAQRAAEISTAMLTYVGGSPGSRVRLDLEGAVAAALEPLRRGLPPGVTIEPPDAGGEFDVDADPAQVEEVVANLVGNALEAVGEGPGRVRVRLGESRLGPEDFPPMFRDHGPRPGLFHWLEVADDGCGMEPEVLEQVFDPFFTTRFPGRGMGMAKVMGIVKAHGGMVRVESEPGRGTRVRVYLPAAGDADRDDAFTPPEALPRFSGTVLLVDDEELVLRAAGRMLGLLGLEVVCARDGREAVDLCRDRGHGFACVIMDIAMPRMDGVRAAAEIGGLRPGLPVILTSGHTAGEVDRRMGRFRPAALLRKPFDLGVLAAALETVLAGRGRKPAGR